MATKKDLKMLPSLAVNARLAKDLERLRWKVLREWRLGKRFDYTESELNCEVDRRFSELLERRSQAPKQLELGLSRDVRQMSGETRLMACLSTRPLRANRKAAIVELLRSAGPRGMTRSELAGHLRCRESDLCSSVLSLLREGHASQPAKRPGPRGLLQAVVALKEYSGG